ncbi:MAG: spore coat associated protein CotJA [Clostridia bacterium]|nr:spore coat associated protein CotJA [Clostridia bacterium]
MPREDAEYCVCTSQPVSLAMAYVPIQEWGNLYRCCEALDKGTLFADLYKPYCMGG